MSELRKEKSIDKRGELLPPSWLSRYNGVLENAILDNDRLTATSADGRLRARITKAIDSAEDLVCASSFLVADPEIIKAFLRASVRGVRVYLLTASEVQLRNESRTDSEFDQERLQEHLRIMQELAGCVLVRTGENLHSKFVLVDPHGKGTNGFLLTANLTFEALTRNVELGVHLTQAEVRDLFKQFLIGFWLESSNELLEPGNLSKVKQLEGLELPTPSSILCTTNKIQTIKDALLNLIRQAKSEIIISSFGFDLEHEVTQELLRAARSGKKVRVLARPRDSILTMNALLALSKAGAEVRGHPYLHAKCVLVDSEEGWSGLIMTSNIETFGLDKGFESGIVLRRNDAADLHRILEGWWESFPQAISINKKLGDVVGDVIIWENGTRESVSIMRKHEEDLGTFLAKSLEEMETLTPELSSRTLNKGKVRYHEYVFRWTVLPPRPLENSKKSHGGS